ncbi:MAG: response regulator transcription factor [Cyanobacteria bacterium NC_groundwater_1444_Ag_S-0.65um_54_12]|nr:response regulator transcription factor [Cyanobacteria bacterium NC_groundwater_1444_Ag_S-0.65um_54_12]
MNKTIRLIIVDDHSLVREGLRLLLATQPDLEVIGEAADGPAALEQVRLRQPPAIVLMDINLPGMNGIEATRRIMAADLGIRVLGLTMHDSPEYFFRMLEAGASGFVLKGATSAELIAAIRSVHEGGVYLSAGVANLIGGDYLQQHNKIPKLAGAGLTSREIEILQLFSSALTNQQVAEKLRLSIHTVQAHRANIMRKLGLANRHQLLSYAMQKGYLPVP